jgi:hypothetical protein
LHVLRVKRNPLRRWRDRWTAAVLALLLALGLVAVPLCVAFGVSLHRRQVAVEALESAHRYRVVAVVVGDPYRHSLFPQAWVRWNDRGGRGHAAVVSVPMGSVRDDTVVAWIDGSGQLARAPHADFDVLMSAVVVTVALILLAEGGCFALAVGVRRISDAGAARAWAHEWEVVAQRWTWPCQ